MGWPHIYLSGKGELFMTEIIDDGQGIEEQGLKEGIEKAVSPAPKKPDDSYKGLRPEIAGATPQPGQGEVVPEYTDVQRASDETRKDVIMADPDYQNVTGFNARKHEKLVSELFEINSRLYPNPEGYEDVPEMDRALLNRLLAEGVTLKSINDEGEEGRQRIADAESLKTMQEAEMQLKGIWPVKEEYDQNINRVKFLLDKVIADPKERQTIIDEFGNDPQMIEAMSIVVEKLGAIFPNFKDAGKYQREPKGGKK